jgi:NADH-quinone oxidoreductase subunit D
MTTTDDTTVDPYAASTRETTEGTVYTVTGGDWESVLGENEACSGW